MKGFQMGKAEPKVNYTESAVERLLELYTNLGNDGIDAIAAELSKPRRSVIAKLVREGVYVAPVKAVKAAKDEGPTKKELLAELRELVDFDVDGLTPATKDAIQAVLTLAQNVVSATEQAA
jgi:phosphosulfolactate synthase (CoM biosynthesis protein A)